MSWVDLYAAGRVLSTNNAFQGNNQLSQNPLGILSAFYSHNIGKRWYAGIGASYDNGGDTSINGVSQHNGANGFRPSISISRARTIWKYRLTLRYELTGTTRLLRPRTRCCLSALASRFSRAFSVYVAQVSQSFRGVSSERRTSHVPSRSENALCAGGAPASTIVDRYLDCDVDRQRADLKHRSSPSLARRHSLTGRPGCGQRVSAGVHDLIGNCFVNHHETTYNR